MALVLVGAYVNTKTGIKLRNTIRYNTIRIYFREYWTENESWSALVLKRKMDRVKP